MLLEGREIHQPLECLHYSNAANTRLLKEEIIPYMGKYVADNREMGKLRDLVTLVAFNISADLLRTV